MKKLLSILFSLVLVASAVPVRAAYAPPNFDPKLFSQGFYIALADSSFGLWSSRVTSRANSKDEVLCRDFEGDCSLASTNERQISAHTNFSICQDLQEIDCISSVKVGDESLTLRELSGDLVTGDPKLFLPSGTGPVLGSGPSGDYLIVGRGEYQWGKTEGYFLTRALDFEITPVTIRSGKFSDISMAPNFTATSQTVGEVGEIEGCFFNTADSCYVAKNAELVGKKFALNLQLSSKWSGFFKGRLVDPKITILNKSSVQAVEVIAESAKTHKVFFKVNWDKYDDREAAALCYGTSSCQALAPRATGSRNYLSSSPPGMAILQAFGEHHLDVAAEDVSEWSFGVGRSMGENCLAPNQGLVGMVTSNAPVFQAGPPSFQAGSLTYEIAGLHFASDGKTVNEGQYKLQIRSDVARCLYGFNKAPVSATVQVTNENGKEVVSTTTVSESDGWLRLNANGFTFSRKKVKVVLSQPFAAVVPAFSGKSSKLTKAQTAVVATAVKTKLSGGDILCTGLYSTESTRNLAIKRATAVCTLIKNSKPGAKTSVRAASAAGTGQKPGAVLIRSE
jgi:hypothetical protein